MIIAVIQKNKRTFGLVVVLSTIIFIFLSDTGIPPESSQPAQFHNIIFKLERIETKKIEEWWSLRSSLKNLSKLGEILFLNSPEPKILDNSKKYQILVWKYGSTIENRHLKQYSGKRIDPFENCSVKNCDITYKDSDILTADIVIFHLHRIKGQEDIPKERNLNQIWAFLTDESPYNTFLNRAVKLKDFNGIFNWSMTYRSDSDIPVPYGRTVLKKSDEPDVLYLDKRRDVLVAIMGSNCHGQNHRWKYVKELQKYMEVHVYGACGEDPFKNGCPGHFGSDCPAIDKYLFYLAFENSNCDEYFTEKLWWNGYNKNSIPIVMGSDISSYRKLLPVDSYINVDDFANAQSLAHILLKLNETGDFKKYYNWKSNFKILNEHGYFQSKSYHFCRICQALNYNFKEKKVYDDLEKFWSARKDCHPAWDEWTL